MKQLLACAAEINIKVEKALREDLEQTLAGCDPLLVELIHYAVFGGGKRVRPLLTVLSSRLCGREDAGLYQLAGAFEYLHVASLIHDDIIDNAPHRRGRASLSAKFGSPSAILAGDWLLSRSMHLIGKLAGQEGLNVFCKATEGMVDGEFLQLRYVADPTVREEDYFAVIRRKTGNLIASTCEIGGIYGGADQEGRLALAGFGDKVGTAFQVVDDLLDYLGDQKTTGKATGNDFQEGKITLPLIRTLAQASLPDQERLRNLIAGDREAEDAYHQVCELMTKYNGFNSARQTAMDLVAEAEESMSCFIPDGDQASLAMLKSLARYILDRKK